MTSIDERIVEMRFENDQFEKNIKESQDSLEKLKSSLRMEESVKSVADSLDKISYRFSVVGIAVEQLTRNLTNSFYSMAANLKNTVMDLSFNQIGVGFDKYEKKLQSVQTIMNATGKSIEEVNVSLDKLNWFTDETSYDFTSMVDNIAKFTSNQIPLETAVTSMIGIADAAGLAGASVADASHAMDGFSKAMGQGYMTARNWNWIKTAHMDTAKFKEILIESGLATKTLKKNAKGIITTLEGTEVSIANFEEGMKDGWMSVKVMNKALKQFGGTTEKIYEEYLKGGKLTSEIIKEMGDASDDLGLKAFRAAQEAKTFTDAINSVKDAVSTGWMTSFEFIFGNYEEAKVMWTNLANEMWEVFNGGAEDRNELLRSWHYDFKGYESMLRSVGNIWQGIKNMLLPVSEAFRTFFPKTSVDSLVEITKKVEEFSVKFRDFFGKAGAKTWPFFEELDDAAENVGDALGTIVDGLNDTGEAAKTVLGPVAKTTEVLEKLVKEVRDGVYGNGDARKKALEELGYSYELVQNKVNEVIELEEGWAAGTLKRRKVKADEVKANKEVAKSEEKVGEVIEEQFDVIKEYVNESSRKTYVIWNLKKAFEGFFSALKLVTDAVKAVLKGMSPLLKVGVQIFEIFTSIGSIIGQVVSEITASIRNSGILEKITNKLHSAFTKLSNILEPVVDWFYRMSRMTHAYIYEFKNLIAQIMQLDSVKTTIGYFKEFAELIKNTVTSNFSKFVGYVKDLVKVDLKMPTTEDFLKLIDMASKKFNEFIEYLKGQNPVESIEGWWGSLVTGAGGIWQTLLSTIQDPNSIFGKAFEAAKQFGMGLVQGLDTLNLDSILSIISTGSLAYFLYSFATALRNLTKVFKSVDLGQFDQLMTSVRTVLTSFSKNLKAEAFIKMAKAIGILTLSMIGLGQLSKEQIASVTVSIIGIVLALKLLMDAMTAMNYSKAASSVSGIKGLLEGMKWALSNAFMWQSFGFMLVGIATALVIFVKALSSLVTLVNESFGEDIKDAFWILTAMLIGFTAFVGLIFKLTKGMNAANKLGFGKIFSSLGIALLFAALAIKIAVPALKDLAEAIHLTAGGDILGVALIISVLGAALAGLAYVLGKTDKSPGAKLLMLAAGFMAIVYAMKYVTPILQDFWHWLMDFIHENKNLEYIAELFKKWWWVLIPLAIAVAALTAVLFVLQNVLQPLGILMIGIGVAAAGIGLGIRLAGDSMEAFAKGLVAAFKVINENKELVIGAVAAIVSGILAAVTKNKAKLIWTVVAVLGGIVEAINIVGPDVIETIGNQIQLAIEYVVSLLAEIVDVLVYMAIQVINALADAIDNNRDPILDAISRLLTALRDLVAEAVKRVFPWLSDWLANFVSSIGLVVAASFPVVKAIGSITKAFAGLKATLSTIFIKSPKNVFSFLKEGLFGVMGATPGDSSLGLLGTLHNIFSGGAFGTAAYSGFKDLFKDLGKKGTMIGIAAVVAGMYGIGKALQNITDKEHEAIKAQHELTNSHKNYISKMNDSYEEFTQQNDDLQSSIKNVVDEYDGYSALAKEFDKLLDSNGKVIEGNEQTADTILNKLSKALGIEKEDLQNLVTEHGNLQSAIDETIKKKEAEALIGSMQEDYVEALSKRTQRQREETLGRVLQSSSEKELEEETEKLDTYFAEMQKAQEKGDKNAYTYWNKLYTDQSVAVAKVNANVQELTAAHDQALEMLNETERTITNYENVRDAYRSGEIASIKEAIELTTQGLPEALKTAKNSTQQELSEQLGAIINGYNQLKAEADNGNQEVTNTMLSGGKSLIVDARNELLKSFGLFDETGKFCGEAYTDAVKEQLMALSPEAVNYIETFLKPSLDADTSEEGASTANTYTEGMITALTSNNDINDQVAAIKDLFDIDADTVGVENADSYISSIVDSLGTGEISIDMAIDSIMGKFGATEEATEKGEETVEAYADSIEDNSEKAETAAEYVAKKSTDAGAEVGHAGGEYMGEKTIDGFAGGLYKFADRVKIAASYVAGMVPKVTGQTLEVRSPSRVAMRLGRFWDLGLARGITENSFTVLDSSSDVSNSIIESMKNAVQAAYEYINSTDEINPRITPVLDLSEIQNGTGLINGMFGNTSLSLASANGVRFEANRLEAFNRLETASTNADVVAALDLLRGDVNNLNDSFANTQVVLDSGALVGATAKQMDNALGRFKTYKGRGI